MHLRHFRLLPVAILGLEACAPMAMSAGGQRVGGIYDTRCPGYEQVASNRQSLLEYAQKLKLDGKISEDKLIAVDQEAGIYSQRLKQLCDFFRAGDINFDQYQAGVERAEKSYREVRQQLLSSSPPNSPTVK